MVRIALAAIWCGAIAVAFTLAGQTALAQTDSPPLPTWIPSVFCSDHLPTGEGIGCGNALSYVSVGDTGRVAVHKIICAYPSIAVDCSTYPSDQFMDVRVLGVDRRPGDPRWDDPREEHLLVHVELTYVDGPYGRRLDTIAAMTSLAPFVSTTDASPLGQSGLYLNFADAHPLLPPSIGVSQTANGWIDQMVPIGADAAMVLESGRGDYVFFGLS
jgi:hypothetical protein